jgi:multidrug resistance efflux pump
MPTSLYLPDQERPSVAAASSSALEPSSSLGGGLSELAIRLSLARRRADWNARMRKQKLISDAQYEQCLVNVQVLEAEISARIFELENELDLLVIQRESRVAEIGMAKARVDRARIEEGRLRELEKKGPGYATKAEVETAGADLRLMESHLASREAALKEVDLRRAQTKKRLARVKLVPPESTPGLSPDQTQPQPQPQPQPTAASATPSPTRR